MKENVPGCYAQKPLKAIERIISASSDPNDLVIDFFAHSGTTLVACERLKSDGSELSERALGPVRNVATAFAAEVLLLQVMELAVYPVDGLTMGVYTSAVDDTIRETVEEYLSHTARRLQFQGYTFAGRHNGGK